MVEDGRAVGVEAGGDAFGARRAVIAALDPHLVISLAGPDAFPARSLAQIRQYRRGLGTFKVDWALDGPVPWLAEVCRRAGVIHGGGSVRAMSKAVWEAFYGLPPARPTLILGQQSLADPSRTPAGKHTLWGYTHVPTRPVGDALQPEAETDWARSAEPFADRMEATIEAHGPGFREVILARRIWTPAGLEAANPNVVGVTSTAARSPSTSSCCSGRGWTGGAWAPRPGRLATPQPWAPPWQPSRQPGEAAEG